MGSFTLVTGPVEYPLTLSEAKEHLRIDGNDHDAEIDDLIAEATAYVERQAGRKLVTQTWKYTLDSLPLNIRIPYPPLQSISSVSYQDSSNATQTLSSSLYKVDSSSEPARMVQAYNQTYPDIYDDINVVDITFVCGYGDRDDVPGRFKRAIKLYMQAMFDGDTQSGDIADKLIAQDKVPWFALEN